MPLPFFGSPYAIAFRSVYVTGKRNRDAIAPRCSCISPSPIGNRYSGRSRGLSQMRQVVPYRRSLFRRSAMNCLSPYASLFTSCVNCIRSLRLPLAATFAKLLQALSRRRQLRSEASGASTITGVYEHPDERETELSVSFSFALFSLLFPLMPPLRLGSWGKSNSTAIYFSARFSD